MNFIRGIKCAEQLLRKNPGIYRFGKRVLSIFLKDNLYDYQGLIDDFATNPNVLYFRNFGKENADIPIYYITYGVFNNETCGFFGMLNTVLKNLLFADFYGLTPVIEWRNCIYSEENPINGTKNVFEYYFEQVSDVPCKSVLNSAHVCLAMFGDTKILYDYGDATDKITTKNISVLAKMYQKYIRLNQKTEFCIKTDIEKLLPGSGGRVLGIQARGSDSNLELFGHPIPVSISEYIETAEHILEEVQFDRIFLATEDQKILNAFLKTFGDKLLYYKDNIRSDKSAIELANENHGEELFHYKMGYEVLRDAYTLSACDSLIGGAYNVPIAARIIKQSREETFKTCIILDKGISDNKKFYKKEVYKK